MSLKGKMVTMGDHPRMCGEKLYRGIRYPWSVGSPPHVRGKDSYHIRGMAADRITPACAGKSTQSLQRVLTGRDHPRMCGEKRLPSLHDFFHLGSPPQVRGKEEPSGGHPEWHRITPACAGKSLLGQLVSANSKDHPRMCGEKSQLLPAGISSLGSPPHVRGKEVVEQRSPKPHGITPACAGKRPTLRMPWSTSWDHPRMCGEKFGKRETISLSQGSPPHVRGKDRNL